MREKDTFHSSIEATIDDYTETALPPLQHQWPLLGQELFAMEHTLTDSSSLSGQPLSEQEKREKRESIRNTIVAQLYRDDGAYSLDMRHLAFLLLRRGRGAEIVGNPCAAGKKGNKLELPYTGLEGYYAGSERTTDRPGMTREAIILEEANIGAELLKTIKKQAIDNNSWPIYARLKHVLKGEKPDVEALRTIEILWGAVVARLHVRIYRNPEFELLLGERIEQMERLLGETPGRTKEEKQLKVTLEAEYRRLKREREGMSEAEREAERQERKRREWIRTSRLEEFRRFREETYQILISSGKGQYEVGVQDGTLEEATIVETITLPAIPDRQTYPAADVQLTPEQWEGYLFLARLGELGGDPLARSVLVSR